MDVKEVRNNSKGSPERQSVNLQKPSTLLSNSKVQIQRGKVDTDFKVKSSQNINHSAEIRQKLNEVINTVNFAVDTTNELKSIVNSIAGIASQASNDDLTQQRKTALEREANSLISEIKKKAETSTPEGIKPLLGDKIALDIEKKLGKTLEFVLPDSAKDSFGLNPVSFSRKDSIIATITNIKKAQEQIERLKNSVAEVKEQVKSKADEIDVMVQNTEASFASVRDLDQAIQLAGNTKVGIKTDPERALSSLGKLDSSALRLLE